MLDAKDLLAHATGFSWDATPANVYEADRGMWSIDLIRRRQRDGSDLWSIQMNGGDTPVWTRNGEWEYQGMPSGRSAEFLARARWTFDEALAEVLDRVLPEYKAHRQLQVDQLLDARKSERAAWPLVNARAGTILRHSDLRWRAVVIEIDGYHVTMERVRKDNKPDLRYKQWTEYADKTTHWRLEEDHG